MGQWSYIYDSLNRVVAGVPAPGNTANGGLSLCWAYDAFGNGGLGAHRDPCGRALFRGEVIRLGWRHLDATYDATGLHFQ